MILEGLSLSLLAATANASDQQCTTTRLPGQLTPVIYVVLSNVPYFSKKSYFGLVRFWIGIIEFLQVSECTELERIRCLDARGQR